MAVDKSYGSGKPRSAANSAARRAAAGKAAGRKKTIKRQASNPGVRLGVSRIGKTENAGFNIGGRQYLETGVSLNPLMSAVKALIPSGIRIAGSASRVVSRAASNVNAAQTRASAGKSMQESAAATRRGAEYALLREGKSKSVRLGLDFNNPVGNRPNQSYNYAIKDVASRSNPETISSANRAIEAARSMNRTGSNTAYYAQQTARRSQRIVDAGKAEAAAEIRRRLTALQRANKNR